MMRSRSDQCISRLRQIRCVSPRRAFRTSTFIETGFSMIRSTTVVSGTNRSTILSTNFSTGFSTTTVLVISTGFITSTMVFDRFLDNAVDDAIHRPCHFHRLLDHLSTTRTTSTGFSMILVDVPIHNLKVLASGLSSKEGASPAITSVGIVLFLLREPVFRWRAGLALPWRTGSALFRHDGSLTHLKVDHGVTNQGAIACRPR